MEEVVEEVGEWGSQTRVSCLQPVTGGDSLSNLWPSWNDREILRVTEQEARRKTAVGTVNEHQQLHHLARLHAPIEILHYLTLFLKSES